LTAAPAGAAAIAVNPATGTRAAAIAMDPQTIRFLITFQILLEGRWFLLLSKGESVTMRRDVESVMIRLGRRVDVPPVLPNGFISAALHVQTNS
jgi:hypothetical protein